MSQNIFEELQSKKLRLLELTSKAAEYGWIPKTKVGDGNKDAISLEEIKDKLDKDTLTIGVIGQMKCGKSTFLRRSRQTLWGGCADTNPKLLLNGT